MRLVGAAILTCLVLACGKHRTKAGDGDGDAWPRWDAPTAEHGFRPVPTVDCTPFDGPPVPPAAPARTPEDVAVNAQRPQTVVAFGESIYWSEADDNLGTIVRATRVEGRPGFTNDELVAGVPQLGDLGVDGDKLFFAVGDRGRDEPTHPGVRVLDLSTRRLETVAEEPRRPDRLIADAGGVLWLSGPAHVREARPRISDGGTSWDVKNLIAMAFAPGLLAVDADAVYVFAEDGMLLRAGRRGEPIVVLTGGTGTVPVDMAAHGGFIYWLDEGPTVAPCRLPGGRACFGPYALRRNRHPDGTVRRISAHGGSVEVIATGLPDVERLTFLRGAAWVTTASGPLRVPLDGGQPTLHRVATTDARYATIGDALVYLAPGAPGHTRLLPSP